MNARILLASTVAILGAVAVGPAEAAPTVLGSFKQWNAYTSAEDGKMCFIAAQPSDSKYDPKPPSKRDPVFFMVTIIPAPRGGCHLQRRNPGKPRRDHILVDFLLLQS